MCGRSKRLFAAGTAALLLLAAAAAAHGARIKDIAFMEGVRPNQLTGYGLVVGLTGTGDKTSARYTMQSLANLFKKMGIKIDPTLIRVKNTAAVLVTAELPPFARPGSTVDVVVSSLGDATSLEGGTLIITPLKGPDGFVYATAQGPISLGGFSAGGTGAKVRKNHQTVGKITGGAIIEKEVVVDFSEKEELLLTLRRPDFSTARNVVQSINKSLGRPVASALDAGGVRIEVPEEFRNRVVEYIAAIESLDVKTDTVSKVVVNERTGTVVMGENVRISTVAVSHGDISIEIRTEYLISQPGAFSPGETVVQPLEDVKVRETPSRLIMLPESVTLGDVVRALNLVGVTPRDLVAILQAIRAAGALQAELEII